MKLCNSKILSNNARKQGYAVPALNTNGTTYDITRAIIEACEEMRSPLIIQCYEDNLEYRGYDIFPYMVRFLAEDCSIPIALQLDHGKSITSVIKAVKAGFTSVMIDCAELSLEDNMAETNKVIDLVKPLGVSVESEVGNIIKSSQEEGKKALCTNAEDVKKFTGQVDVDMLAVAVGTTHGIFEEQKNINFDLISEFNSITDIPLVLHGTCGVSLEGITKCVNSGMSKINFGEAFRMNYIRYFNEYSEKIDHEHHVWRIMRECKNQLKEDIKDIIRAVGSEGKADDIKL